MKSSKEIRICRNCRKYLMTNCLWPLKGGANPPLKYLLGMYVPFAISFVLESVAIYHMKILLEAGYGINALSEDYVVISAGFETHFILILYYINRKKIAGLMLKLSYFEFGEPENFEKLNKKHDFYVKIMFYYVLVGLLLQVSFRMTTISECRTRHLHENCGFVSSSTPWVVLSIDETPGLFVLGFLGELAILGIFVKTPLTLSYLILEFAQHLVLRFDHLNKLIVECLETKDYKTARGKFNKCVEYHNQIINYAEWINKCFATTMLSFLGLASIVLAVILHHILQEFSFGFIPFAAGWSGTFFVACLAGQQLTNASFSVGHTAYNSKWYNADLRLQKDLVLLIMRSQKPLYVKAGNFDNLSYALFLSVMKMSYSVLTFLN